MLFGTAFSIFPSIAESRTCAVNMKKRVAAFLPNRPVEEEGQGEKIEMSCKN